MADKLHFKINSSNLECTLQVESEYIPANIWLTESGIIPNVMKNNIQECVGILSN